MNYIVRIARGRFWFLAIIISIVGCAALSRKTIPVKVQKPAEVTLTGIKTLAVFNLGVWPGIETHVGGDVAEKLTVKLVENGYYKVVEDLKVKQALVEHGIDHIEQAKAEDYQAIGKMLGVDGLLLGTVGIYSLQDSGEPRTRTVKEKKGEKTVDKQVREYVMTRTATVTINFRVVDSKTGMVLAALSRDVEMKDTNVQPIKETGGGFLGAIAKTRQALGKAKTEEEKARELAIQNLVPSTVLFDRALDNLGQQIVVAIAPHYVDEKRILETSGHKLVKSGYNFAARELWDDAKEAWEAVIQDNSATKAHPRAWYNLGIYYELNGDLDQADECFSKGYKLKDDILYLNARGRIKERQKELAKLKEQEM